MHAGENQVEPLKIKLIAIIIIADNDRTIIKARFLCSRLRIEGFN